MRLQRQVAAIDEREVSSESIADALNVSFAACS